MQILASPVVIIDLDNPTTPFPSVTVGVEWRQPYFVGGGRPHEALHPQRPRPIKAGCYGYHIHVSAIPRCPVVTSTAVAAPPYGAGVCQPEIPPE